MHNDVQGISEPKCTPHARNFHGWMWLCKQEDEDFQFKVKMTQFLDFYFKTVTVFKNVINDKFLGSYSFSLVD